jgi:L-alanine-DL-glutamate epimerase-like enolase superfamily enzyme
MHLSFAPYHLKFRHPFRLATGTRTGTDSVFVRIEHLGYTGYGEATLPPYLTETQESVVRYLLSLDVQELALVEDPMKLQDVLPYSDPFARCAVEEAWLDVMIQAGKIESPSPLRNMPAFSSLTLGMGTESETLDKLKEAEGFPLLKIKLANEKDIDFLKFIRANTKADLCVDANQGWKDIATSISFSHALKKLGVLFIEQPFSANEIEAHAELTQHAGLPVIADESVRNLKELKERLHAFSGVNIKLLKCGGPWEAFEMLHYALEQEKFTMVGCMSESSCGVYHAALMRYHVHLMDLDGPLLINNDPFSGYQLEKGKVSLGKLELIEPLNFIKA